MVWFDDLRITLVFSDGGVLLASLNSELQHALGQFVAECEVARIRLNTSKSEALVLSQKRVVCSLHIRNVSELF